ncbi:MAG: hypothetical protein KIG88_11660 [Weeksellaceae bacterium]|nr:hypothetical protein [Weeksellaceae bacterium]
MEVTEFKVGDVVELKTTHSGINYQFVVSGIDDNYLTVVWFNKDEKDFKSNTLIDKVFRKAI